MIPAVTRHPLEPADVGAREGDLDLDLGEGRSLRVRVEEENPELAELLAEHDAVSFAFLPLLDPEHGPRRFRKSFDDPGRQRARLPKQDWSDGTLQAWRAGEFVRIPGVWALGLRRYETRLAASALELGHAYWSGPQGLLERHSTSPIEDEDEFEPVALRAAAFQGLEELRHAAAELVGRRSDQATLEPAPRRLLRSLGCLAVFGALVYALTVFGGDPVVRALASSPGALVFPFTIALVLGLELRGSAAHVQGRRRELSKPEAREAWIGQAPFLVLAWAVAALTCALFGWARLHEDGTPTSLLDDIATDWLLVLWLLVPIARTRDRASLLGTLVEGGIAFFVTLLVVKLTTLAARVVSSIFWSFLGGLVPLDLPPALVHAAQTATDLGAELVFVALAAGYTWRKSRILFERWATT